ncbi:MAG: threonine--tRNA ligase [Malacoplasma sp.]
MDIKIANGCILILLKSLNKMYANIQYVNSSLNDDYFYLDFYSDDSISSNDFIKIEKEMKKVVASGQEIKKIDKLKTTTDFDKDFIAKNKDYIFIEIDKNFESISHNEICGNVNKVKFFKLTSIGGVSHTINGKEININRICGVAFDNNDDYVKWEHHVQELKEKDHRRIGQSMEIFTFEPLIGQGLPIWLNNGEILKNLIKNFLIDLFVQNNFSIVDTPILGNKELYIKSGHWEHYKENNFPPIKVDDETYMLRPMTCPHHIVIFNQKNHSYKEMPYLICENAKLHRYESSGGLIGLERVRAMELFDAHIFAEKNDVENIILKLNEMLKEVYEKMNIHIDEIHLSLHDEKETNKFHNDPKMWKNAEDQLRKISKKLNYKIIELKGEAAFYGPKIDFQVKTNLGKIITISTIQLDFLLPQRFECNFINTNNEKETPVLIHFGVIGTYERFISTLLSQTKGVLPIWLAPKQVDIIPINNDLHLEYAKEINKILLKNKIRSHLKDDNERLSKKIRDSQTSKVPYQIIIGDNEVANKVITIRNYGEVESSTMAVDEFISMINK